MADAAQRQVVAAHHAFQTTYAAVLFMVMSIFGVGEKEPEEYDPVPEDAPRTIQDGMRMFTGKAWKQDTRFTKDEFLVVVDELRVPLEIKPKG